MSRRGSPAVQVLIVIVVVLCFLYGFYSYHEQHTRLKHLEETNEKCKLKAESLSAQLQVLYEHKTRLESTVQKEKELHKETKEDLELKIKELQNEQNRLTEEKELASEQLKKTVDESSLKIEKAESDLKSSQQQHINEIAVIRDELVDYQRRYNECLAMKESPASVSGQQNNFVPEVHVPDRKVPEPNDSYHIKQPDVVEQPVKNAPQNDGRAVVAAAGKVAADDNHNNIPLSSNDESLKLKDGVKNPAGDGWPNPDEGDQNKQNQNADIQPVPKERDPSQQMIDRDTRNQGDDLKEGNSNVDKLRNEQEQKLDEDYEGDIEKSQKQQAADQIAKPVGNSDSRQVDNENKQVADNRDGAGL